MPTDARADIQIPVPENDWLAALDDVPVWRPPEGRMLVIAPHPDDETLGAGGLIAAHRLRGCSVQVIAVTDGEASYSDWPDLGAVRAEEQMAALAEMGVEKESIIRLHM